METLIKANETLNKMSANIKLANDIRKETVQDVINSTLEAVKSSEINFSTKKNAISHFLKIALDDKKADTYTIRATKVAKVLLVDGYKIKKELLSLAQMEQILCFKKSTVIDLMKLDDADYVEAVKELINSAKIQKGAKVFNKSKAKNI